MNASHWPRQLTKRLLSAGEIKALQEYPKIVVYNKTNYLIKTHIATNGKVFRRTYVFHGQERILISQEGLG
jgi:hypothetical protein